MILFCLTVMVLLTGCSTRTPESSDAGIVSIPPNQSVNRISLHEAIALMSDDDIGLGMGREPYTIHNVIGRDLDRNGMASIWILSINTSQPFYFIYENGTIHTMPWNEVQKDHAINLSAVLSPEDLFLIQRDEINNLTGNGKYIDELELRNGIYHLRGNQPSDIWERNYDATTGKEFFSS